jgi:FAD dependent oxidoreductase TIGR03364
MSTCVVVGGGILGTLHAYFAQQAGMKVLHLESSENPDGASVRNFGLIWVSGRRAGDELLLALRARKLWDEIGDEIPRTGFRRHGSLTLARNESEWHVARLAAELPDASARGFELLDRHEVLKLEPAIKGVIHGALRCAQDAIVEPQYVLGAIRQYMQTKDENYLWKPNCEIVDFSVHGDECRMKTADGELIQGDYVILAPGAAHYGVFGELFNGEPIRRVRLQMAATEVSSLRLQHSLADADSFRYYPAYKGCELDSLGPQHPTADEFHMQLLLAQRLDGSFTIGDTHEYQEPLDRTIHSAPYDYLSQTLHDIFGSSQQIVRKWDGIYSQMTDEQIYFRKIISPRVHLISGLGGRGNTLSPAVAETTLMMMTHA